MPQTLFEKLEGSSRVKGMGWWPVLRSQLLPYFPGLASGGTVPELEHINEDKDQCNFSASCTGLVYPQTTLPHRLHVFFD